MKITYLGTTMLLFDDGINQILFDCHVTRPSIKRCMLGLLNSDINIVDKVINDFNITRLKGIFISHSHHDHILDAPNFAIKTGCRLYGSLSSKNIAIGNGVSIDKIYCYSDSMEYKIGDFHIKIIPSIHSKPHWYNNDIGKIVDKPFKMPASIKKFKEGGSFDFLITYKDKKYLIRPSYNYIENQFNNISADVLFLGIGGMSKDNDINHNKFFNETIAKVRPNIVIPIHWDNFFLPLYGSVKYHLKRMDDTDKSIDILSKYCSNNNINCVIQLPLTSIEL